MYRVNLCHPAAGEIIGHDHGGRKHFSTLRIYGSMPRYFFHVHNDMDTIDEEGIELPDADSARERGLHEARNLAAESIKTDGHLVLGHRIEIVDEAGERIATVKFGDAVAIRSEG